MGAGRRRPRCQRQIHRRDRCCPGKQVRETMDFSPVQLSDDDSAFRDEARDFLRTHVTEDVLRRDRETGDNFDEGVHLALGAAGYLARDWKSEPDGGFNRVRRRIWDLEKRPPHAPWGPLAPTAWS